MKPRDNAKVFSVRFIEGGTFEVGDIIHDTIMPVAPRVGETITLRHPKQREEMKFSVTAVDYLIDVQEGISPVEELTGVRVLVRARY